MEWKAGECSIWRVGRKASCRLEWGVESKYGAESRVGSGQRGVRSGVRRVERTVAGALTVECGMENGGVWRVEEGSELRAERREWRFWS